MRARPVTIPVRLTVRLLRIVPAHPGDVIAALDPASLEQLDTWTERVLDAATLDEVFR